MANPEHDNLEADLSAYLDGELNATGAQAVERLLAESDEARRTLAELRQVRDQLAALPRMQIPAKLAESMVQRELFVRTAAAARRARTLRLFGQATAAAAVLVVGVIIGYRTLDKFAATKPSLPAPAVRAERGHQTPPLAVTQDSKELAFAARGGAGESKRSERSGRDESTEKLKSLGYVAPPAPAADQPAGAPAAQPESVLAEAPGAESTVAASLAVVIQTRYAADYAANAAILAGWAGGRGPAAAPAVATDQPIERVYQVQAPELAARLNQILDANPRGQVELQQGREAEDSPVLAQVAEALGARAAETSLVRTEARPAEDADKDGLTEAGVRATGGEVGAQRGAAPAKSRQRIADRETESMRERVHQRQMAVTAEPDLTIVLVEPPATAPARAIAPSPQALAPPAAQPPKQALLDQLMGLLLKGGPRAGGGAPAAKPSTTPITLRVRVLPPPSPTLPAQTTTAPTTPAP